MPNLKSKTAAAGFDLITGGTGLLGSHLAEQLVRQGTAVRALVRPGSDTTFLRGLGVELFEGDLIDPAACAEAVDGARVVYHAAAKVGDWGTKAEFRVNTVEASETLAAAALGARVQRFVQISSTSAYGHPIDWGVPIDETAALGQRIWIWDDYTWAKVEAERRLWALVEAYQFPLTVIRPSWLYGERDRTTFPRLLQKLKSGGLILVGRGTNPISAIYAGQVAEAAILAAHHPAALGEAFNVTDQGFINQSEFFNTLARLVGGPRVWLRLPYWLVYSGAFEFEAFARLTRAAQPPLITRYATWLMGRSLSYSTAKARSVLGWVPREPYAITLERTVRWFQDQERGPARSPEPTTASGESLAEDSPKNADSS